MEESLTHKISIERENDVSLITGDIIKAASQRLKPNRTDLSPLFYDDSKAASFESFLKQKKVSLKR